VKTQLTDSKIQTRDVVTQTRGNIERQIQYQYLPQQGCIALRNQFAIFQITIPFIPLCLYDSARHGWEDNIEMDLKETEWGGID
jgi:hypothetical protein